MKAVRTIYQSKAAGNTIVCLRLEHLKLCALVLLPKVLILPNKINLKCINVY